MDEIILKAVERAIEKMRSNLGDKLTIDDLARSAMFSKFHFSRVFQRVTGVSPGRFLSAMRIEEAKRLLLSTSITVADIGHRVGYNSVGTFSSRFSGSVGVSPITYRQLGGVAPRIPVDHRQVADGAPTTTLRGHVYGPPVGRLGHVFVAMFPSRVPEGAPVRYAMLNGPGPYQLQHVPVGTWYLTAHAVAAVDDTEVPHVSCYGPFTTGADIAARLADLQLRPTRSMDPPLLLALPDLRAVAELDLAG
jgi:AraC-like DNA-binding protein